jgi:LmbE family N-acetylglucosaminyl deacetylase
MSEALTPALERFPRALIVVAHPDDETIGAGALLARGVPAAILHLTDGAPRDPELRPPGSSRLGYAETRRAELDQAMDLVGLPPARRLDGGAADQEAALELPRLARLIARAIGEFGIELVLTHPYEGGHPDHDAAAFAVRAALSLATGDGQPAPDLVEMAFYNEGGTDFLESAGPPVLEIGLGPTERRMKRRLLGCYASQSTVLAAFPDVLERERFRCAPAYDFTRPPHAPPLYYERQGWMEGARWRDLARAATEALFPDSARPEAPAGS